MNPTRRLHDLGQSLWLDNITREMLQIGTLRRYIAELSVTGLTSNPTIYDQAIRGGGWYDEAIHTRTVAGLSSEAIFFELALEDLTQAADLFGTVHRATGGTDGWVSLEVSPLLAHDTSRTLDQARLLHRRAARPNLFIKIPGTPEGLPAIEEAIVAGVPVNVTLLFSREQYLAAAGAYQRGVARRIAAGLDPAVASVASVFISRWDKAVQGKVPAALRGRLGIAIAGRTYRAYRDRIRGEDDPEQAAADASKAVRLQEVLQGPMTPDVLPAQAVRPVQGRLTWMVDEPAAGRLRPDGTPR